LTAAPAPVGRPAEARTLHHRARDRHREGARTDRSPAGHPRRRRPRGRRRGRSPARTPKL